MCEAISHPMCEIGFIEICQLQTTKNIQPKTLLANGF